MQARDTSLSDFFDLGMWLWQRVSRGAQIIGFWQVLWTSIGGQDDEGIYHEQSSRKGIVILQVIILLFIDTFFLTEDALARPRLSVCIEQRVLSMISSH